MLPSAENDEERRSLWRQSMATLARDALEQQPVPLEGIDPKVLLEAVRTALTSNLVQDLDWLSPPAAAAAVYELATAIPMGPERRQLGRHVLTRLYEGDATTFVVLATSLAAESRRTLTGAPIRARVALALELPIGAGAEADSLALALISRHDLRREWLSDPSTGSLPSRRLSARLLERAARASARRAAQGDSGSLRAFEEPAVRAAWQLLLSDRESLVWRHVATARGLLSRSVPELAAEIEENLDPRLTPTEWRRAAVSLAASIAANPQEGIRRCRQVLGDDALRTDTGLPATMIFGLARAAESEPEAAEDLLNQIVRVSNFEAAEAMVELRRERVGSDFGVTAAGYCREWLQKWLGSKSADDDGRIALCEALIDELSPEDEAQPTLRDKLDGALRAFSEEDARTAFVKAQQVFQDASLMLTQLEQTNDDTTEGRRAGFRALRELDSALMETATLCDLLNVSATKQGSSASAPLAEMFERLTNWLLRNERRPIESSGGVPHLTMRLGRLRTLLHVVDADGIYGEDSTGQRKDRRMRTARVLLGRARADATSPLRRIVCAALARACDGLMRDEVCELSDVLIAATDNIESTHDLATLAEASMMPEFQRSVIAYAELARVTNQAEPTGRTARASLDALKALAQSLPWASTLRVSALRSALMKWAGDLEGVAGAGSIAELAGDSERGTLSPLEDSSFALAQLTMGARRRLRVRQRRAVPAIASALSMLDMAVERNMREPEAGFEEVLESVNRTLSQELPGAVGKSCAIVLGRVPSLPREATVALTNSFVPPAPKQAPLPPWLPARRTLGGFYVLQSLGAGGVGSVFVVVRAEERHQGRAVRFALKVPDYNAEAARTLSEEEFLTLFREEAGALLSLPEHGNLAGFVTFDAGAKPKPILVMELVEGPTLERTLERGDLDVDRALTVLEGIGAGLEGMHRVGIGHLDLKPSNVIMRKPPAGSDRAPEPVLVDFGLAGRHIRPGCATGAYGAPEVWGLLPEGHSPQPMSTDTYAYACVIYEVLTGDTLFDAVGELATINSHLSHDGYPEKLMHLRTDARLAPLCDLVANALRQHPGERISVRQMRDGLRELRSQLAGLHWPLQAA